MPAAYQGTLFRSTGDPIVDLKPPAGMTAGRAARAARRAGEAERARHAEVPGQQRAGGAHLVLRARLPDAGLRARAPSTSTSESEATKKLYGLDDKITEPFGRQCLMARRLVEHGVRFVQIFPGGVGNQNIDTWDAHGEHQGRTTPSTPPKPTCRSPGLLHRPEGARPARLHAGHHGMRVRPHADLAARRRPRSQPGRA